ncbi:major facilitator superfamily domain-containing protein [Limtongia smithiae]|uniref:major facilitator superfamily domain-containing protein n=1 Tax=Limtongia smithiae TaxID=1125753 RepID=UPI0034CF9065
MPVGHRASAAWGSRHPRVLLNLHAIATATSSCTQASRTAPATPPMLPSAVSSMADIAATLSGGQDPEKKELERVATDYNDVAKNTTNSSPQRSPSSSTERIDEKDVEAQKPEQATLGGVPGGPPNGRTGGGPGGPNDGASRGPPRPMMDLDKGLVGWESMDDPECPMNWKTSRKWRNMVFIIASCFLPPLTSTLFAPGESYLAAEFHETRKIILTLMISIFVLGFGYGPMMLHAPLSELYGRKYVICSSTFIYAMFNLACSLSQNTPSFLAFRFLGGFLGSAAMVVGGGVIQDTFPRERMGTVSSAFALGPLLGPNLGPIIGGFMAENAGWRWCFRFLLILGVCISSLFFIFGEETHHGRLLLVKTAKLRKELNRPELISQIQAANKRTKRQVFWHGMSRPIILLCTVPTVTCLGLYMAVAFSFLYIFMTTIPTVYREIYHFNIGIIGLCYLGMGAGQLTGILAVGRTNDKLVRYLTEKNGGVRQPEFRLRPLLLSCILIPVAMFWYGWVVQKKVMWFAVVASMYPLGLGMVASMLPIQTYLIEVYGPYGLAASATAAGNCFRMTAAAFFPLVTTPLYDRLGHGWGSTLLGFLALTICSTMAISFMYYGKTIRERFPPRF